MYGVPKKWSRFMNDAMIVQKLRHPYKKLSVQYTTLIGCCCFKEAWLKPGWLFTHGGRGHYAVLVSALVQLNRGLCRHNTLLKGATRIFKHTRIFLNCILCPVHIWYKMAETKSDFFLVHLAEQKFINFSKLILNIFEYEILYTVNRFSLVYLHLLLVIDH